MAFGKSLEMGAIKPRLFGDSVSVAAPNGRRRLDKATAKEQQTSRRRIKKAARRASRAG